MLPISIIPIFFRDALLTEQNLQYNIYIYWKAHEAAYQQKNRETYKTHPYPFSFTILFFQRLGSFESSRTHCVPQSQTTTMRKANTCGFDGGMAIMVQVEVRRIPDHQSGKAPQENGALFRGRNSHNDNNNAPLCLIQFVWTARLLLDTSPKFTMPG